MSSTSNDFKSRTIKQVVPTDMLTSTKLPKKDSLENFYINRFGSSIDESFFPYKVLWSISALVIVVNFGTLILRIVKFDRENITKILKGGAL